MRGRRVVIGIPVVALAAGAFLWWGQPHLGAGAMSGTGAGMSRVEQEDGSSELVVAGRPVDTARAVLSIRNDGRLPVTVLGFDDTGTTDWFARQQVRFVPGLEGGAGQPAGTETVTLGPGDSATVLWSLGLECQPGFGAGMFRTVDELQLKVRWLGFLPGRQQITLREPISFVGDEVSRPVPGPECDRG